MRYHHGRMELVSTLGRQGPVAHRRPPSAFRILIVSPGALAGAALLPLREPGLRLGGFYPLEPPQPIGSALRSYKLAQAIRQLDGLVVPPGCHCAASCAPPGGGGMRRRISPSESRMSLSTMPCSVWVSLITRTSSCRMLTP